MVQDVIVAGVGMIPFVKPGRSAGYDEMGATAAALALADAGVGYDAIQQAYAGYVYGDSTAGQRALYRVGMTGIPVINVNNNCATGSTALYLARQAVESGAADCVLAVGFEQMVPGALGDVYADRPSPLADFVALADRTFADTPGAATAPMALKLFGGAGWEYRQRYGAERSLFAKVREKAARHAEHNDKAIFRRPVTVEEMLAGETLFLDVTRLDCCPPTCGAAAVVLCGRDFAARHGLRAGITIAGQAMVSDFPSTFADESMIKVVGAELSAEAARQAYEMAAIEPRDIDVVELHDCFTFNEVLCYEALGLCPEGGAAGFVADGANTYGGRVVTNPSGGLLSKGHPLGATGLAQCAELVWQLRGDAGPRQVEGARIAVQHNIGLGGAAVVTVYRSA